MRDVAGLPTDPRLAEADLVVLSHLRWDWVWQRPQHLISRQQGRRIWFVEQAKRAEVDSPRVQTVEDGPVVRVWMDVPLDWPSTDFANTPYLPALTELLGGAQRDVWLYDPIAVRIAEALRPRLMVYDMMDDLASFADAPPEIALRARRALTVADVVFTGGRSLHRSAVSSRRAGNIHLFPSGVECDHYATSRQLRQPADRPVAGYVGVLDERLDLPLIADVAAELPDWEIQLVGPTTKIDPASLPAAQNLRYLGMQPYSRLPEVMAGFDVALMPFALNEATRSISPTKTLEYLAAGLPVVSTRVPDVVADWGSVVHLADDGREFAAACRHVATHSLTDRDDHVAPLRRRYEWDTIASQMHAILSAALPAGSPRAITREEIA